MVTLKAGRRYAIAILLIMGGGGDGEEEEELQSPETRGHWAP